MGVTRQRLARVAPSLAVFVAVMLVSPAGAPAEIGDGHPELTKNVTELVGGKPGVMAVGWGQLEFGSAAFPSAIECVNVGFGDGWNEEGTGRPLRAYGQILAWDAAGHMPVTGHAGVSAECRPEESRAFATDEAWVTSEENAEHEVKPTLRKLSTPWNVELRCGVREEEYVSIIKIGVPNSEFPGTSTACPPEPTEEAEAEEVAAHLAERSTHQGCYKTNPAPEGCIRVTIVQSVSGLEMALGGTLWPQGLNGAKNGLSPTKWKWEGTKAGELQCEFPEGCSAPGLFKGVVSVSGAKVELLAAR